MGFRLDALMDGISPKTMPTTMENTTETTMDRELIATGTDAILEISCASPVSYTHLDVYKRQVYSPLPVIGATPAS